MINNSALMKECVVKIKNWNPSSVSEDEFTYIDISAVDKDLKKIVSPSIVLGKEAPSRARQLVEKNDILVSTVRPNLNSVAVVTEEFDGATASTGYTVLRTNPEKLNHRYLFHWVKSNNFVNEMVKLATGQNYPAISDRIILDSYIPLPPLSEQKRIADILDRADELRQKRQQSIAKLDELLQATFIDMFGDFDDYYEESKIKLSDIARINPKLENKNLAENEMVAFMPMADVKAEQVFAKNSAKKSYAELKKGFTFFNKNDILIAKITPCFENGKIAIADINSNFGFGSTEFHVVNSIEEKNLKFLAVYLRQKWIREIGEKQMTGSAGQKRVPKIFIENLPIPKIDSGNINSFNKIFDNLQKQKILLTQQLTQQNQLFQSLQQQAFNGTL